MKIELVLLKAVKCTESAQDIRYDNTDYTRSVGINQTVQECE